MIRSVTLMSPRKSHAIAPSPAFRPQIGGGRADPGSWCWPNERPPGRVARPRVTHTSAALQVVQLRVERRTPPAGVSCHGVRPHRACDAALLDSRRDAACQRQASKTMCKPRQVPRGQPSHSSPATPVGRRNLTSLHRTRPTITNKVHRTWHGRIEPATGPLIWRVRRCSRPISKALHLNRAVLELARQISDLEAKSPNR